MRSFTLSLSLLLALAAPALADELRFTGGRILKDDVEVVSESYEEVVYRIHGSPQKEPGANVIEIIRTNGNSRYKGAQQRFAKGEFKAALADFDAIVKNADRLKDEEKWMVPYSLFFRAECQRILGDSQGAIASYQAVLDDNPKTFRYAQVKLGIGDCKMAMGDRGGARTAFSELETDAKSKKLGDRWANEANFRLADISEADGKDDEALQRYKRVADTMASQKGNAGTRAKINVQRLAAKADPGKADYAAGELEKLVDAENAKPQSDPEILAAAYNALGDVYAAKGDHRRSLLAYLHVAVGDDLKAIQAEQPHALYGAAVEFEKAKTDDWKARAEQMKGQLRGMYPSSPWARKLG